MFESPFSKKSLILSAFFSLLIILAIYTCILFDNSSRIVFCDVGQGDGAYIRIKNQFDILIDAGPDRKILDCLAKYMPFYDREIELAIITHPERDHFGGFLYVVDRYKIDRIFLNPISSSNIIFKQLESKIKIKNIKVYFPNETTKVNLAMSSITFYWPTQDFLKGYKGYQKSTNNYSVILTFKLGQFKALFTGDASPFVLDRLLSQPQMHSDILKIPHHGSKIGLTSQFLNLADPDIAVISVGRNNSYGHPSKEILDMLKAKKVKIRRTDLEGDIVFKIND